MASPMIAVSKDLQKIAKRLDKDITKSAGERVGFSLFVWTDGRCNYVSNSTNRAEIKRALLSVVDGWDAGMPDIPNHEIQG